jgi:DNA (cytosine-5)-methyltransferase 1
MGTSKKSTGTQSQDQTLFAADILASHSAKQANAKANKTHDTYGHGYAKPLADYDPDTQSWKMYGDTYLWGDSPLLENLPASGMTQNGVLFQQPAWEPIIDEIESSLWPTPVASDAWTGDLKSTQQTEGSRHSLNLSTAVRMWPTPTTMDHLPPRSEKALQRQQDNNRPGRTTPPTLKDAVAYPMKWPTPTVDDSKNVNPKPNRIAGLVAAVNKYPIMSASGMGNTGSQQMLQKHVDAGSLTDEEKRAMTAGNGGRLNPTWVEWLMGFPTGWTDLEDSETQ